MTGPDRCTVRRDTQAAVPTGSLGRADTASPACAGNFRFLRFPDDDEVPGVGDRIASCTGSIPVVEVRVAWETPPTLSSTPTFSTPLIAVSSSVTEPTQCAQIIPEMLTVGLAPVQPNSGQSRW